MNEVQPLMTRIVLTLLKDKPRDPLPAMYTLLQQIEKEEVEASIRKVINLENRPLNDD